jgi:hypothetical protein
MARDEKISAETSSHRRRESTVDKDPKRPQMNLPLGNTSPDSGATAQESEVVNHSSCCSDICETEGIEDSILSFVPDDVRDELARMAENGEGTAKNSSSLDQTGVTSQSKRENLEWRRWSSGQLMASKFFAGGKTELATKIRDCHSYWTRRQCVSCQTTTQFWNRCDIFYCPQCSPRLAANRLKGLMWFVQDMENPKHLVLTFVNTQSLTKGYLQWCKACLSKFRRRKIFSRWLGGLWAMEITNEGKGWHVHFHLIVDGGFVQQKDISDQWREVCGDGSFIVHISSCTQKSAAKMLPIYVTKYAGKGFRPQDWTAEQLCEFAGAVDGVRTFGVFGSLYKARGEWREFLASVKEKATRCVCGCQQFVYLSEVEWLLKYEVGTSPPVHRIELPRHPELPLAIRRVWPD